MQKYTKGDHVKVAKDLGEIMNHFQNDCEAIVIGSYADQYGGSDTKSYTIHIKGSGSASWYRESQLKLIEKNRLDLLHQWEKEEQAETDLKSDLDWIFSNGNDVIENPHGASIQALASCFGLTNLWGSRGEGFVYYQNAIKTLALAESYLKNCDKDGWIKLSGEMMAKTQRGG